MERSFIMVKPDGVNRGLIGEIVRRFEQKGYKLIDAKLTQATKELAEEHYAEHIGKPFFNELVEFIISGPVFAMIWEGEDIVEVSRMMIGANKPVNALPGTIRGDFSHSTSFNVIHGSDSVNSAKREINLWFN
ncbi:nucleoside-diphosphate kinase [Priestia aryabhattai]